MTELTREQLSDAEDAIFRDLARRYSARCAAYRRINPEDQAEVIEQQEVATCAAN